MAPSKVEPATAMGLRVRGDRSCYPVVQLADAGAAAEIQQPRDPEIPAGDPLWLTQPGAFCGDWPMFRVPGTETHPVPPPLHGQPPATDRGQEGVHIIDVNDPEEPKVVAFVDLPCASHADTLVHDPRNDRLLVYSNPSPGTVFGSPTPREEPVHCKRVRHRRRPP